MKKAYIIAVALAVILSIGTITAYQMYMYPQTATIGEIEYTLYIDSEVWANGTVINWGTIYPGNGYYYNLTVQSLVPSNTTVYLTHVGLPATWDLTWDANATLIEPEGVVFGWLNLTIPSVTEPGTYSWDSYIKGEYT